MNGVVLAFVAEDAVASGPTVGVQTYSRKLTIVGPEGVFEKRDYAVEFPSAHHPEFGKPRADAWQNEVAEEYRSMGFDVRTR